MPHEEEKNCSHERTDPIIAITEKGKTFRLENSNRRRIVQVRVDDCLITGECERCDWLFEIPTPNDRVCYVELKGKNIEKAISQIISTIEFTRNKYASYKKEAYIVSSRVPMESTSTQVLRKKLKGDFETTLVIRCKELVEKVA